MIISESQHLNIQLFQSFTIKIPLQENTLPVLTQQNIKEHYQERGLCTLALLTRHTFCVGQVGTITNLTFWRMIIYLPHRLLLIMEVLCYPIGVYLYTILHDIACLIQGLCQPCINPHHSATRKTTMPASSQGYMPAEGLAHCFEC